jgi:exopolysaccharide biosynthesis polyprenyl glycosylphosphotransferase
LLSSAPSSLAEPSEEDGGSSPSQAGSARAVAGPRPRRIASLRLARSVMAVVAFVAWFALLTFARYLYVGPLHTLFIHFIALSGLFAYTERVIGLHDMEQAISLKVALALALVAGTVEVLLLLLGSTGWNGAHSLVVVGLTVAGMLVFRVGVALVLRSLLRRGLVAQTIVVVGPASALRQEVLRELDATVGVRTVAILPGSSLDELHAELMAGPIDQVILVAGLPGQLQPLVDALEIHAVDVLLVTPAPAGPVEQRLQFRSPIEHGRVLQHQRQSSGSFLIKRSIDLVGAGLALVLLSPLLLAIAVAIRLDSPGPALFKQVRWGYGGREFLMWKFRSMRTDTSDHSGSRLTTRNDSRVTRLGALLRSTSLDELPQLVNILKGELSIVGPRPHPCGATAGGVLYDDLIGNFKARYRVRPGLTGLAQCSGLRGNTDTEEKLFDRFEKDMEYVETWTILGDIKIMLRTVVHVIRGENAY